MTNYVCLVNYGHSTFRSYDRLVRGQCITGQQLNSTYSMAGGKCSRLNVKRNPWLYGLVTNQLRA